MKRATVQFLTLDDSSCFNLKSYVMQDKNLSNDSKAKAIIERAKDKFAHSNHYNDFLKLYDVTQSIAKYLPWLSVITGTVSLTYLIHTFLPFLWLCAGLGVFFVAMWEYWKGDVLSLTTHMYLKGRKKAFIILCLASLIFCSASSFVSVDGGGKVSHMLGDKTEVITLEYASKIDSIAWVYNAQIAKLDSTKGAFFNAVKWRGKLPTEQARKQFADYEQRIKTLEQNRDRDISLCLDSKSKEHVESNHELSDNSNILRVIAAIIELLIILSNIHNEYFEFEVNKDGESIEEMVNGAFSRNISIIQNAVRTFMLRNENLLYINPSNLEHNTGSETGFKPSYMSESQKETKEIVISKSDNKPSKETGKEPDYNGLIQAIQNGDRSRPELMKKFKCNVNTVNNFIQMFSNENK